MPRSFRALATRSIATMYAAIRLFTLCVSAYFTTWSLAENLGLHLIGILLGNLVFNRRGNGNLAGLKEHIARVHFGSAAREILQRFLLRVHPVDRLGYIKTLLVIESASNVS